MLNLYSRNYGNACVNIVVGEACVKLLMLLYSETFNPEYDWNIPRANTIYPIYVNVWIWLFAMHRCTVRECFCASVLELTVKLLKAEVTALLARRGKLV